MQVLNTILQMSLAGSILFIIICIFKPITKRKFSATWNYYMSVFTLLVFIIPILAFVKFPEFNLKVNTNQQVQTQNSVVHINKADLSKNDDKDADYKAADNSQGIIEDTDTQQNNFKEAVFEVIDKQSLNYVWLLGVIVFLAKEIYIYFTFDRRLKKISSVIDDESKLNILEKCKKELNIKRKIVLKQCLFIKSPMITGIFNPIITIPKKNTDLQNLEIILKHELIHYKRKDLFIKIIALAANSVNWFNPIVYILRNQINMLCELSLDEQIIKNMNKTERKHYGEIILEEIEYSQNKSLSLGTSVCRSRKELEERLKKIVFFKKSHKLILSISLLIAVMFVSVSLFTVQSVFAKEKRMTFAAEKTEEFAVFVSGDGLYMSDLKSDNPILIEKAHNISQPIISKDGRYVAYVKGHLLSVCDINTKEVTEVSNNVVSYNWNSSDSLFYSVNNSGMTVYDAIQKKSTNIISNDYTYDNIVCNSKNKIYANKKKEYGKDGDKSVKNAGIISYDLDNKEENILLKSTEGNNKEIGEEVKISDLLESIGSVPIALKVTNDDKYLYIWNKAKSGSISADMTQFAVYDLINNKLIQNDNMVTLTYKDNLSENPADTNFVAVNNGENRDMWQNKTLGIYNIKDNAFQSLIPKDQVSMMPDYSSSGENIVYSGSKAINNETEESIKTWENESHSIYEVDVNTKQIKQITNSNSFDFMPKYLSDDQVLFVRKTGNSCTLLKTKDGVETKLADGLKFEPYYYYGHYDTEKVIDVFRG